MKTKTFIVFLFFGLLPALFAQTPDKKHSVSKSSQQSEIITWTPYICSDAAGNFVITWAKECDGVFDIYAQRFSSDGTAQGDCFSVNEIPGTYYPWSEHAICSDDDGNFVIVWADHRNGGENLLHSVYAQRYASDGSPLGENFRVNDDAGAGSARWPSITCDSQGSFIVAWVDQRSYRYEIYAQRFSSDGTPQDGNFNVNDNDQVSAFSPCVSVNSSGQFVIAWRDNRNEGYTNDIYAQCYSNDGSTLGANFKVNDDQVVEDQQSPSVCIDDAGSFVIAWADKRNGSSNSDIYAQRYASDGTILGNNVKINDNQDESGQYSSSIAGDNAGNYTIAWMDARNSSRDIYAQRFTHDGSAQGVNFKVNDEQTTASQCFPTLCVDGSGDFIITWEDNRTGDWDIFSQRFSSDGTPFGANFKVNQASTGIVQNEKLHPPSSLMLGQNYPNPFNPCTGISYSLPEAGLVSLVIYDVLGHEIRSHVNAVQAPGTHSMQFDGKDLPSGVYVYVLKVNGQPCEIRKMMLLR